jgi:ribosomal protein L11 methyltransferase
MNLEWKVLAMPQTKTKKDWYVLEITVSPELEEIASSILWEEGTAGITTTNETPKSITLQAYFDKKIDINTWQELLVNMFTELEYSATDLKSIQLAEVPDEDWLKKWKEGYRPVSIGEKFLITPSWLKGEVTETNRLMIEIDPGMAFGTGTHETTQLCLRAIEKYWKGGSCIDVGCGTGILAMAAAKVHPEASIVACDNDPEAIEVARENLEINQADKLIKLAVGSAADYRGGNFSLVVANLTADVIASIIEDLVACQASDGLMILSGILDIQEDQVCACLAAHNQEVVELLTAGEWISIVCRSTHKL